MVERGFATAEDVDKAMTLGCAHPMGPPRLIGLISVDTPSSAPAARIYEEFLDVAYAPPTLPPRGSGAGPLREKAGRGHCDHR